MASMAVTIFLFSLYIYLFSPTGFFARKHLQEIITAKYQELGELEGTKIRLAKEFQALQSDTATLEAIARNHLNLVKPGETVYREPSDNQLYAYRMGR